MSQKFTTFEENIMTFINKLREFDNLGITRLERIKSARAKEFEAKEMMDGEEFEEEFNW